jgi:hypothetical protein
MDFNIDRLAILSGVIDRDEYTESLLVEDKRQRRHRGRLNEMEATVVLSPETPEELAAVDDLALDPEIVDLEPTPEAQSASGDAEGAPTAEDLPMDDPMAGDPGMEEVPPPEDMEEELEERLRRAIRHEVQVVLAEVMAQEEDQQIEKGRKMKNVGVSMGFAGVGFKSSRPSNAKNKATSRGPGGTKGFGGPGFW